jgi:undecaprenyl-diphosphatase
MEHSVDVRPGRTAISVAAGVVAASLAIFALIAEDVLDGGGLIAHDQAVFSWFVEHRTDRLIDVARFVSTAGGFVGLTIMGIVLAVWLTARGVHLALAAASLLALLLASVASTAAKAFFDRQRPPVEAHAIAVGLAAFPSAHATNAAAFFLCASFVLAITSARRAGSQAALVAVGAFLAALVGVSRLVLAVHWLSDVVAGWALGTAIAVTVFMTAWLVISPRRRSSPSAAAPAGWRGSTG